MAETTQPAAPLFPAIRDVAEETDKLPASEKPEEKVEVEEDEERPVTEVESLCMQCGQNVCPIFLHARRLY